MHFHIAITTCDRQDNLRKLLRRIRECEALTSHTQETWLYNDGGGIGSHPPVFRAMEMPGDPHGKRLYWRVMRHVWDEARQRSGHWDAFLFMQDDIKIPDDNFFDAVANLFACLEEKTHKFAALNLFGDGPDPKRTSRWTGRSVTHTRCPKAWSAKWIDLQCVCFHPRVMTALPTIEPVPQDRWIVNPTLSSGVGRQLSRTLCAGEYGQYMVKKPWVEHSTESIMNQHRNGEEVYA